MKPRPLHHCVPVTPIRWWKGRPVWYRESPTVVQDVFQPMAGLISYMCSGVSYERKFTVKAKLSDCLSSIYEMTVPISRSPQRRWWGLVLAEMCPAQWVTLHVKACLLGRRVEVVHWLSPLVSSTIFCVHDTIFDSSWCFSSAAFCPEECYSWW